MGVFFNLPLFRSGLTNNEHNSKHIPPFFCTVCLVFLIQTITIHIETSCCVVMLFVVILFSLSPCTAQKQTSGYHRMPALRF